MKQSFLLIGGIALSSILWSSCSKGDGGSSDPDPNPTTGKTYKFTITASGVLAAGAGGDRFTLILSGGDMNGSATLWKINGVTRSNERTFTLDEDDFAKGETYVIESLVPLLTVAGSVHAINNDAIPITFDFQPVVNGKNEARITQTVTKDFNRQLSY
jgi:hypothetical protein